MILCPCSCDTCDQCWKYSNELCSLSCQARVAIHNKEQGENVEDMEVDKEGDIDSSSHMLNEEFDAECNKEEADIRNDLNSNNSTLQNYSRETTL